MIAPLSQGELRGILQGGTFALDALDARIASATGDLLVEVNQLNEASTLRAIDRATAGGARLHMLADARVPGGGADELIDSYTVGRGGRYVSYGSTSEQWQHAKSYHFDDETGPEAWLGNLAPIAKTRERSELSLVVGGDAAAAARTVADTAITTPGTGAVHAAVDAAAQFGVLSNDPHARVFTLNEGIRDVLDVPTGRDLFIVTKGIEHPGSTNAIIDAHRAGRAVQVFVRDIAHADGVRLADAGVDVTILRGGLQPRVNVYFSGERGITSTAFLWENMVGARASSRDSGVLLDREQGRAVREAAVSATHQSPDHVPLVDALRAGELPAHI
jgi:hypothetical protein